MDQKFKIQYNFNDIFHSSNSGRFNPTQHNPTLNVASTIYAAYSAINLPVI